MPGLKDLDNIIEDTYDTGRASSNSQHVLTNFWEPVLSEANYLFRGVAYFTSGGLISSAKGFKRLIEKDNAKIQLLVGVDITRDDYDAIERGHFLKADLDEIIYEKWIEIRNDLDLNEHSRFYLEVISFMIAVGILEVRVVHQIEGDFHCKYAHIKDEYGDSIVLMGSNNESQNAIFFNSENFSVNKSWHADMSPTKHFERNVKNCEDWWKGIDRDKAHIIEWPEACKADCIDIVDSRNITKQKLTNQDELRILEKLNEISINTDIENDLGPKIPKDYELRYYQEDALNKFFAAKQNKKGIFKHCTAAGKTFESIYGVTRYFLDQKHDKKNYKLCTLVTVEYDHLAIQWKEALEDFGWKPMICSSSYGWEQKLAKAINNFRTLKSSDNLAIIVLNDTFMGTKFNNLLSDLEQKEIFFIGDECHHHHSRFERMPNHFEHMLGLSATPENPYDEEKSDEMINNFYGGIAHEYTIEQGLNDIDPTTGETYLTPFDYHLHRIDFTESENEEYMRLTRKLFPTRGIDDDDDGNMSIETILSLRAAIISNASGKISKLEDLLKNVSDKDKYYTLIYSGGGGALNEEGEEINDQQNQEQQLQQNQERQLNEICKVLQKNNWSFSKYTSDHIKNANDGQKVLRKFQDGRSLQALVAIRCLDEGLNIPKIKTAYITASNRFERQYIQRVGRILRRDHEKKKATIHDFFVFPHAVNTPTERNLILGEKARIDWFSNLAINGKETKDKIKEWSSDFPILKD